MTVAESPKSPRAFHAPGAARKAAALLKRFSLPPEKKVRQLSRGNRARLCLLLALSFNPELIILDEPTSGLDPIVRRDFIENIVSEISEEDRKSTRLNSSHLVISYAVFCLKKKNLKLNTGWILLLPRRAMLLLSSWFLRTNLSNGG